MRIWFSIVSILIIALLSGCGGGGAAGGAAPAQSQTQTTQYIITYSATTVNTTNLYINGVKVSSGDQFNKYYDAGSTLVFTFDDQCVYNGKTYQADTYRVDYYNDQGTSQPVKPGGVTITLTKDTSVLITYTEIPPGP